MLLSLDNSIICKYENAMNLINLVLKPGIIYSSILKNPLKLS